MYASFHEGVGVEDLGSGRKKWGAEMLSIDKSPVDMTTTIYVLRLEEGRYYVGKTNDVQRRYEEHLNGHGSAWTRKYRPITLERTISGASSFDEDKVTKELMAKYGIEKVRGGTYVKVDLDVLQWESLILELRGATDKCLRCGRSGHFVSDCYARLDVEGREIKYLRGQIQMRRLAEGIRSGFVSLWDAAMKMAEVPK